MKAVTPRLQLVEIPKDEPGDRDVLALISDPVAREVFRLKIEAGVETEQFTARNERVVR